MTAEHKEITKKLDEISEKIKTYLSNQDIYIDELGLIVDWLSSLIISFKYGNLNTTIFSEQDQLKNRIKEDGMLIINSSSTIIRKIPNKTYEFKNNIHETSKLIDFIDDTKKDHFIATLSKSIILKQNIIFETLLKTDIDYKVKKCLIEIDISSSNIKNDRIIIYYKIVDNYDFHSIDLQSVVFDNLPNMDVFFFDKEYRYILCGGKEKEKYNLTNSDFIGKRLFDIYDKKSQRAFFSFYNKALNGEPTEGEVRYKKDIYYLVAKPIYNDENKVVAGIIVSLNVTKDKLLEENLIKSKEQAQKSNKAKTLFLANLSHEIRTPLNSIIGFNEQLRKTNLNSKQEKFVDLVNKSSEHLLYLVNEIVFLFKLGMDKVYIDKVDFNIYELLSEIKNISAKQAKEKNLKFITEIDNNIPKILKGDSFRLRQVLMNLINNAIKYTDSGSVTLSCSLKSETKKSVALIFEVIDTGMGIHQKDIPNIFDVFEQGDTIKQKAKGGAGLGLGICKKLISLFNGKIYVKSKVKKGSTFTVHIPFEKSSKKIINQKEKKYKLHDNLLEDKRILIADDDEHNLLLADYILKEWKSNYTLVKNGQQAADMLRSEKFDIILLDINMPKKNGVKVVKEIRSENKNLNYSTPMLALTANVLKSDISRFLKAGFDDYITKPFKEYNLYNKLCNLLQLEDEEFGNKNELVNYKKEPTSSTILNFQELEKIAKGDDEFFNKMIDNFIKNSEDLLKALSTYLKLKDWNGIGERSHKAISSFKFFKLSNIANQLEKVENTALRVKKYELIPELISILEIEINFAIQQAKNQRKNRNLK